MTREEAIKKHRQMWNWLADNPNRKKKNYITEHDHWIIYNDCYLCDYARDYVLLAYRRAEALCVYCPLAWPGETCCAHANALYDKWRESQDDGDYKKAAEIARMIAELPEKKKE